MITSEEVRKQIQATNEYLETNIDPFGSFEDYISQQEELTTAVKRYFEISSGNIGDNLDEFMRLEKEINEMVKEK